MLPYLITQLVVVVKTFVENQLFEDYLLIELWIWLRMSGQVQILERNGR
jgi:hypothetical protein